MSEVKQQYEQQGQRQEPRSPLGDEELRAWWLATTEQSQQDTIHTAPGNTHEYERDASGKKNGKGDAHDSSSDSDLRNYVFYSDPLSREDLRRSPDEKKGTSTSSKRNSSQPHSPTSPLIVSPSHKPSVDYATVIEEGGTAGSEGFREKAPDMSYYTRMAAEEAEAVEKLPAALHNPKVRIQLAKLKPHRPWFLGLMTLLQVGTLIASFVINQKNTGSIIQTNPFNYMIGPTSGVLISMGARFVPCMRTGTGLENVTRIECPIGIQGSQEGGTICTLADICGFTGLNGEVPNQWYRFITAIGLHGGVLHLAFNMSFQVRTGFQMEKDFGWWRIAAIYLASGIAGFVFGANFNPLTPSVGCSGALYGLMACLLLDLFQNWRLISRPWLELFKMLIQIVISLLIGMLPFIDNFAHIGGFYTGIVAGLLFMPTIHFGKWDKWRKRILMIIALPALVLIMVFLIRGFYGSGPGCTWCKYLNCIPGMPWCEEKWSAAQVVTQTNSTAR
ncbi:YD repeat (two copies) [Spizellomyces punctatus DAOM BR117]|uniref:Rhomboid-type serine protease n=1 Tax=Spizellomyces punctatus (strain DAOM BR117) TaxID=645134 RepID=A0A0L0H9T1_SPIPD|nr:YD repeat (two copies) [Spizellomyces punctatus DAOM BR117]KNC97771.1 YD repeat (two copies) [Spizellomyces punctatus DAOM BR117]|eukprot:XP_016605811.1 YD repeat (two copies) [Spizellomyces punctatus DAOM BR117]